MTQKPESKPPEETPTPSTVSLPSFTEWFSFFETLLQRLDDPRVDKAWKKADLLAAKTHQFLAQRGSPR